MAAKDKVTKLRIAIALHAWKEAPIWFGSLFIDMFLQLVASPAVEYGPTAQSALVHPFHNP